MLSKYGKVIGAKVVANARGPSSKCFGYVLMASSSDAEKCIEKCKGLQVHGRVVIIDKVNIFIIFYHSSFYHIIFLFLESANGYTNLK